MAPRPPQRRTTRRIARLRVEDRGALAHIKADNHYTPRERREVRRGVRKLNRKQATTRKAQRQKATNQYNPLAPLTGERAAQEQKAATDLEFGSREQELRNAQASQAQTTANRAAYYDDYKNILRESAAHLNESNRVNAETAQSRVDTAYTQDKAAVASRDAAASEQAAKLGRGPVASQAGAQAVEAGRTAGNESVAGLRRQGQADDTYVTLRVANAAQGKLEDQGRQSFKAGKLRQEGARIAKEKGEFGVKIRGEQRQSEREYALARKEFGLKKEDIELRNKVSTANQRVELQKAAAQKLVAKLYSDASRAKARATVRVAELQLKKGKISKNQMRTIRNIYEGLPGGGTPSNPNAGAGDKKPKLQTWERDKVSNAVNILKSHGATRAQKNKWIQRMQNEGVPLRLARTAWNQYIRRYGGNPNIPSNK